MTDFDVALARRQFARSLWILVIVQIVGLCVAILGFLMQEFPFFGAFVPRGVGWQDGLAMFTAVGVCMSVGAALGTCFVLGFSKMLPIRILILPIRIQIYGAVGCLLACLWFLLMLTVIFVPWIPDLFELATWLAFFWWLVYCPIPQFFIARWLVKETKVYKKGSIQEYLNNID